MYFNQKIKFLDKFYKKRRSQFDIGNWQNSGNKQYTWTNLGRTGIIKNFKKSKKGDLAKQLFYFLSNRCNSHHTDP